MKFLDDCSYQTKLCNFLQLCSSFEMQNQEFLDLVLLDKSDYKASQKHASSFQDAFLDLSNPWPLKNKNLSPTPTFVNQNTFKDLETFKETIDLKDGISMDNELLLSQEETQPFSRPLSQYSIDDQDTPPRPRRGRKKRDLQNHENQKRKRDPYATKNLLQTFAPFFTHYIKDHLSPSQYRKYSIIKVFMEKKCKNLRHFQDLLNEPGLHDLWKNFFEAKEHYRLLASSKVSAPLKKIYFSRINIFEKAFRSKVLDRIN